MVWHVWGAICANYFPHIALTPASERWAIDREAYRGTRARPSKIKPDLVIKRLRPAQPQQNLPPQVDSRDVLWIECKAAKEDTPSGWKNVLGEATERLESAHPNRRVFLIIAIGWKCLFFAWDPIGAAQTQLFIQPANSTSQPWMIDPRIRFAVDGPWLDRNTGEILLNQAMTLECFSSVMVNGQSALVNGGGLQLIENLLLAIEATPLPGLNPTQF